MLTQERIKELVAYDPVTGIFTRLSGYAAGPIRGSKRGVYLAARIDGVNYYMHRLAWLYMTGEWPADQIDHANGDASDNAWANLREATVATNARNRKVRAESFSGIKGLRFSERRGITYIRTMCKRGSENISKNYNVHKMGIMEAYAAAVAELRATREFLHADFAKH